MPTTADSNPLLDALIAAYLLAVERGELPDQEQLIAQHPEQAAGLRAFFADLSQLDEVAVPLRLACGADSELRRRVKSLLPPHADAVNPPPTPAQLEHEGTATTSGDTENNRDSRRDGSGVDSNESQPVPLDFLSPSAKPGCLGTIGQYEVHSVIGRGGMGLVLNAFDTRLDRIVAIKVLAPELAANVAAKKRFLREAKAAAAVTHPHVVTIHAVDEDRVPFLVMEMVEGKTLRDKIESDGTLELKEILRIGSQIASGLAAAHKQGLIHRDIKPANILLENGVERVKITDFGLARAVDDLSVTRTGEVAGTPQYMSPEQAQGERVDHRSDLFSLGCVMYAMCTGRPPFRGDTVIAVIRRVIDDTPRPVREINPEIPKWLCDIITKLLEKKPADRHQSAAEVALLLEQHLSQLQHPRSEITSERATPGIDSAQPADPPHKGKQDNQAGSTSGDESRGGRSERKLLIKSLVSTITLAVVVVLAGILIQITNKDGTKTTIEVPDGSKVEISHATDGQSEMPKASQRVLPDDAPAPAIAPFSAADARRHQDEWAAYLKVPVEYTNSIGMKFRLIPPGKYLRGSPPEEIETAISQTPGDNWRTVIEGEGPRHAVTLTQPFYIATYETTQEEYEKVTSKNPSEFSPMGVGRKAVEGLDTKRFPVEIVSFYDSAEFCTALSRREQLQPFYCGDKQVLTHAKEGTGYRLPTEAEWEYACRAGTTTLYHNGDTIANLMSAGWFDVNASSRTHSVGELAANAFGLHDMHGNVDEWCDDVADNSAYRTFQGIVVVNPQKLRHDESTCIFRGGNFLLSAAKCRSASRNNSFPGLQGRLIGFRAVLSVAGVKQMLEKDGGGLERK